MKYITSKGKSVTVPDDEIQKLVDGLKVSKLEAMHIWLEDNEYEINEEQEKLNNSANKVKVSKDVIKKRTKSDKPRTIKVSDEKQAFFAYLKTAIEEYCLDHDGKCTILKENKLISIEIGEKVLKIDLIEQRQSKN